ncbi:MAG: hypothetical protein ACOZNI_22380 [Myxococcota bacterium]
MLLWLVACGPDDAKDGNDKDSGEQAVEDASPLGTGDGTPESVGWTTILDDEESVSDPRDLGFDADGRLWVANREDDRTYIVFDPGTDGQQHERRKDGFAEHFMEETAALSFDTGAQFGSCGESENTYNDRSEPNEFMGPVLWSTDLDIFAEQDPEGLGSHLDMLHESPLCVGIAWETDNVYWVFDGYHGAIVRYDFQTDHGVGQDDHSNGIVYRLTEPEVKREPDAPGHMAIDPATGLLYVADTGNGRVLWIDTATGEEGGNVRGALEPLDTYKKLEGVEWGVLIEGLDRPGGLALTSERLYIGEHGTGVIHEYDLDGNELRTLDTGVGETALYGIEVGPDGKLWVTETATPAVKRIDP